MSPSSLAGHLIELLDEIVKSNLPADKVISDFYRERRYLGSHDRRWITEKTYSIIRNYILLRELATKCTLNSQSLDIFLIHEFRFAGMEPEEIEGAYSKLLETYRLTGNEVDLGGLSDCTGKRLAEIESTDESAFIQNSFPDCFGELLPASIQQDTIPIMVALNHEARVCVRVDTGRISRDEVISNFRSEGFEAVVSSFSPIGVYLPKRVSLNNVQLYRDGLIEIQEEASQIVGLLIDPKDGEIVVDACAGAGGKSLELASLSKGQSVIYALDVDRNRLDNLKVRAERSGFKDITAMKVSHDGLAGIEHLVENADKVIVDAPCTGSGTIRRNPDKKFRLTKALVEKHAVYQRSLLKHYADLVKVGGLLFYVTCSIFADENQSVVEWFLKSDQRFERINASDLLTDSKLIRLVEDGFLATYPHRHEMDGFFAAAMRRVS